MENPQIRFTQFAAADSLIEIQWRIQGRSTHVACSGWEDQGG